jgi:broad specificity phosphatase PhoE
MVARALTLHLVRHGETAWNHEGRIQGHTPDIPLNSTGEAQALEVAASLAKRPIGAVIASDFLRTLQTAAPTAEHFALPVLREPALRERNFGVLEGKRGFELTPQERAWMAAQHEDPDSAEHGGESDRALYRRVAEFLDRLVSAPPAPECVLFAHGGSIRVALAHLDGFPVEQMPWIMVENGAIHTRHLG